MWLKTTYSDLHLAKWLPPEHALHYYADVPLLPLCFILVSPFCLFSVGSRAHPNPGSLCLCTHQLICVAPQALSVEYRGRKTKWERTSKVIHLKVASPLMPLLYLVVQFCAVCVGFNHRGEVLVMVSHNTTQLHTDCSFQLSSWVTFFHLALLDGFASSLDIRLKIDRKGWTIQLALRPLIPLDHVNYYVRGLSHQKLTMVS